MNPFASPEARRPAKTGLPLTRQDMEMLKELVCKAGGAKKRR